MKLYIVIKECEGAPSDTGHIDEIISYMNIEEALYDAEKFNDICREYPMLGSARIYEFDKKNKSDLIEFVKNLKNIT